MADSCEDEFFSEGVDLAEIIGLRQKFVELECESRKLDVADFMEEVNQIRDNECEEISGMASALNFLIRYKSILTKRLKSPLIQNSLSLDHRVHQKFVECCKTIPHVSQTMESLEKMLVTPKERNIHQLIPYIEKEHDLIRRYMSQMHRFKSDVEEFGRYIMIITESLKTSKDVCEYIY